MSEEVEIKSNINEQIDEVKRIFTSQFHQKMFKYGIQRLAAVFNIKYDLDRGFRGVMIEDIIAETFASFTKEGGRIWNKSKFPQFERQLFSGFDSLLQNMIRKEFEKSIDSQSLTNNEHFEDSSEIDYNEMLGIAMEVLTSMNATQIEIDIFEPYYIHRMKREDVAEYLGVEVKDITNAGKKLDRKLPELRIKLKEAQDGE